MKVSLLNSGNFSTNLSTNTNSSPKNLRLSAQKNDVVDFRGLYNKEDLALFIFDLDGTFVKGKNKDLKAVLDVQKNRNAILTYATGRTLDSFKNLQKGLKHKGVHLPDPQYLICNDGQYIYKNVDGKLVEDADWNHKVKEQTNFDKDVIYDVVKKIAHSPEYLFDKKQFKKIKQREDVINNKEVDKGFLKSKIGYYEWDTCEKKLEFYVTPDIDMQKLQKTIQKELSKKGIKTKIIITKRNTEGMAPEDYKKLRQKEPFRISQDGKINDIFICAADKSDGVDYLHKKLDIPYSEVVMAGNDSNDICMSKLTDRGAFFICVANATKALKNFVWNNSWHPHSILAQKDGAQGILEGINSIITKHNYSE